MQTAHFEKLARMYLSAPINKAVYGTTTCKISEKRAEVTLKVSSKYFHALHAMHGSVYFKLLDDAAFFAVNSVVADVFVLTKSFNVHMKRPVSNGILLATGQLTGDTAKGYLASSQLLNEDGKIIGSGEGIFVRSSVALTPEIGYR